MALEFAGILILFVAGIHAGLVPTVEVLQGPSSRTTLLGPDGSSLSASAPGGTVVTNDGGSGLIAAGQAILDSGPEIVVAGPAGSISTINTLAGPAIVPAVAALTDLTATNPAAVLEDVEGAYVADNTELLYDDGSYTEEH